MDTEYKPKNITVATRLANASPQLKEIVDTVVTACKCPHLLEDVIRYVKQEAIRMHKIDRFFRDVQIVELERTSAEYSFVFDTASVDIPKYRDILGVAVPGYKPLAKMATADALHNLARNTQDCWYLLGTALHIRSRVATNKLLVAILAANELRDESKFYSWIAAEHPYALVDSAARWLYTDMGLADKARAADSRTTTVHDPEILREQLLGADVDIFSGAVIGRDE